MHKNEISKRKIAAQFPEQVMHAEKTARVGMIFAKPGPKKSTVFSIACKANFAYMFIPNNWKKWSNMYIQGRY